LPKGDTVQTTTTTQVERKKTFFDHLKAVHSIIDSVGTLLKMGAIVIAAVVSLLSYLDKTNRLNVVGRAEIEIANVFNQPEAIAIPRLKEQGFIIATVLRHCSNSVPAGHVRQVFIPAANSQKTVLVDKPGVTQAGRGLQPSTAVTVQLGNGQRCT
jgi:hypothetical protein